MFLSIVKQFFLTKINLTKNQVLNEKIMPKQNELRTPTRDPAYAKAAEAAQSAYYDPNRPQCAYVPPPEYYESPPAYTKKYQ